MRRRLAVLAALVAVTGCSHSPGTPSSSGTPSPTAAVTTPAATGSATATASLSPSPTGGPAPAGRLAFVAGGRVHVVAVSSTGRQVGAQRDLGAVLDFAVPSWSPKGRYLAWLGGDRSHVTYLHVWDSTTGHEATGPVAEGAFVAQAAGVGARLLFDQAVETYDRNATRTARKTVGDSTDSVSLVPDPATLLEQVGSDESKGGDLVLISASGARRTVGHVDAIDFLGRNTPRLSVGALRHDGAELAIATEIGQDGGCAPHGLVHRIPLGGSGTDRALALPPVGGEVSVQAMSMAYSAEGVLGAALAQCHEGGPAQSAFVELVGDRWVTRMSGIAVAARGPRGLLAARTGGIEIVDYAPQPKGHAPLEIRDASGRTVLRLASATSAVWAPTATYP